MEMFYTNKDFSLTIPFENDHKIETHLQAPKEKPSIKSIYVSTGACVQIFAQQLSQDKSGNNYQLKVLDQKNKKQIYNLKNFPIVLSNFDGTLEEKDFPYNDPLNYKPIPSTDFVPLEELIAPILKQKHIKVFVVNGMGTGLGDGIIGFTALNILHKRLSKYFSKITIDLGHTPVIGSKSHQILYSQESIVNQVVYLPITVEKICEYDVVIDNSAMIIRDNFNNQPMIDFYLETMAIDSKSVPDSEKRCFIKLSQRANRKLELIEKTLRQNSKTNLVLLHTHSSTELRSMPKNIIPKVIKKLIDHDENITVVTWDNLNDNLKDIDNILGDQRHRHINLNFKYGDFDTYTSMVAKMDAVVTVDTSTYHIADSFDIPTVVIFSTIDPTLRLKYYPYAQAVELEKNNKLLGVHVSDQKHHIEYVRDLWNKLDLGTVTQALTKVQNIKNKNKTVHCPICKSANSKPAIDKHGQYSLYQCIVCDLQYTDQRSPANYDDMYQDEYDHYLATNLTPDQILANTFSQIRFETYLDFMQSQTMRGKYLDFGCANGTLVAYAKRLGHDAYGIDISKAAVDFAKNKFSLAGKVQVAQDIKSAKNLPKQFDIISSFEVVEHLPDPVAFAKQVYEKLTPGGYWIFSTPNRNRIQFTAGVKNTFRHAGLESGDNPPEHLQRFTDKSHRYLAEHVGFDVFHQCTSRVHLDSARSVSGEIPNLNVKFEQDKNISVAGQDIKQFMENYYQPLVDGIEGYGNFLFTICRKPLD